MKKTLFRARRQHVFGIDSILPTSSHRRDREAHTPEGRPAGSQHVKQRTTGRRKGKEVFRWVFLQISFDVFCRSRISSCQAVITCVAPSSTLLPKKTSSSTCKSKKPYRHTCCVYRVGGSGCDHLELLEIRLTIRRQRCTSNNQGENKTTYKHIAETRRVVFVAFPLELHHLYGESKGEITTKQQFRDRDQVTQSTSNIPPVLHHKIHLTALPRAFRRSRTAAPSFHRSTLSHRQ